MTNETMSKLETGKGKYHRLLERRNEVLEIGRKNYELGNDTCDAGREMDCIDHVFECERLLTYETIALFCKENNIQKAVDIGCAYGHQSECFLIHGIDYLGLDNALLPFWNREKYTFVKGVYPCSLPIQKGDLGVSVMCLTWNCYLYDKEKTLQAQCEALVRDFDHCILYITQEASEYVSKYFPKMKKLSYQTYYFSK